jgi:hypothetical protein
MKRVEGVEDLNSRIIRAQGILGVGATIRMPTSSCLPAEYRWTVHAGCTAEPTSSCQCACSPASSGGSS